MATIGRLRVFYLCCLSSPPEDRLIYRAILRRNPRHILELGLGTGERAVRMIQLASRRWPPRQIRYTAIDLFEARSAADGPGITLKMAHRLLQSTGARIQLVPGNPHTALSQVANSLGKIDLIVVSSRVNQNRLARAWFYIPRLLHPQSQVFLEQCLAGGKQAIRLLGKVELCELATAASRPQAA